MTHTEIFDCDELEELNCPWCDCNNDGQPEMAAKTGNTYIYETMTNGLEIATGKSGIYDHRELEQSVSKGLL